MPHNEFPTPNNGAHLPRNLQLAHIGQRRNAALREINRWLTTYPRLTDADRELLAQALLTGARDEVGE